MNTLEITDLHKSFGSNKVLDGLTMSVKEGSVFGFIGQNGAGKTTTMKIILGLLSSDSGNISVCEEKVKYGETKTNRFVGYLPDVPSFYGYMNCREYLSLCGDICGLNSQTIKSRGAELLDMVGLKNNNRKITGFSRGMKQRLGIAQALLSEPQLLICDEPTSALDPVGRKEILDILDSIKGRTTVIFSTHILSDVERICDTAAILHNGKIVLSGSLFDMKNSHGHNTINIYFSERKNAEQLYSILSENKTAGKTANQGIPNENITCKIIESCVSVRTNDVLKTEAYLLHLLSTNSFLPVKFEIAEPDLESMFMEVIQ